MAVDVSTVVNPAHQAMTAKDVVDSIVALKAVVAAMTSAI